MADEMDDLTLRETVVWVAVAFCIALVLLAGILGLVTNARNNAEVKVAKYTACAAIEDSHEALLCVRGLGK